MPEYIQCQSQRQQDEGQRQHVRVHVAQHEAEEGEFVNDLHAVAQQVLVVDETGGAPPPPSAAEIEPSPSDLPIAHQLFYVQPIPEAGRAKPFGVEHFQDTLQVAEDGDKQRA